MPEPAPCRADLADRLMGGRAVVVLGAMALSTFLYVTAETLPIGLLPLMAEDLGRSPSAIGLLVTVYGLIVVVASIPLTKVTQRVPRKLVLSILMVVFVVSTATSALVDDYWLLMGARVVTALTQALFWSVVTPATAALFEPRLRPRALSILYAGSSLSAVIGVPAGTWLGQQTNWRVAFLAVAGLGLVVLLAIVVLLPNTPAGESDADRGWAPDTGRYWALLAYITFTVTGSLCAFTYIVPFLTDVSGFTDSATGPLLAVRGIGGLLGVAVIGALVGRNGWLSMTGMVGLQLLALSLQWLFGSSQVVTVIAITLSGLALSGVASGLGVRVLEVAPRGSDMALAGASTAFNVGITTGALLGGILLPGSGVRSTALAGAALTLLAFAVALLEPRLSTRHPSRSPAAERLPRL
ncbi:MFS transporter [Actinoplanes sp. NPDC051861]|uniref:MFS transporter n=1 Tax=Actinoplanes sp. NPDC051861 TaxID=3155170 RepID=UPI003447FFAB